MVLTQPGGKERLVEAMAVEWERNLAMDGQDPAIIAIRQFWHAQDLLPAAPLRTGPKIGRNDPCPCGSGRKYKRCCGSN